MMRVLVWGMTNNRAGTEAVISSIVSALVDEIRFDFLSFEELSNHADVAQGGNSVHVVPNKRTAYLRYKRAMADFYKRNARNYDAMWTNLNILNNIDSLRLAARYGIPRRILHSHNSSAEDAKPHQKALCVANRRTIDRYVTERWACSGVAGRFMFGDAPFEIVPNAIDLDAYSYDAGARETTRGELGLDGAFVVGAVGRLVVQKNYIFLLDAFAELRKIRPDSVLLLVGDGPLLPMLAKRAGELGVADATMFLGTRSDIAALLSTFDVFAIPSLFEGLPVSLLEAQAAGLQCVVSEGISGEAVISDGVSMIPLDDPMRWAKALARAGGARACMDERAERYALSKQGPFLKALFDGGC